MNGLDQYLLDQLDVRTRAGTLRKLKLPTKGLIDFTSNDYLGLAQSPELRTKIKKAIDTVAIRNGATGSRLLSGNSMLHEELESLLKKIFKAESCLLFNSGYAANTGVLSCIASRNDTILYDELCHASIKDGIRLSLATRYSFRHNDLNDLEQKINRSTGKKFIVVESVYSMDGDISPLEQLVKISDKHGCFMILDEAHSTGSIGENGAGLAVKLALENKIPIRIYTFGKAIGSHGACVAGSKAVIDYLINFSKPFIYTTALPDHNIVALKEAFEFIRINPSLQMDLKMKIELFQRAIKTKGSVSHTAIQTVHLGSVERTRKKADDLVSKGFDVRPIFAPTVPLGSERLRICLHTFNSDDEIMGLTEELNKQ
jgi:8-amino-7-oxononanoate synthase